MNRHERRKDAAFTRKQLRALERARDRLKVLVKRDEEGRIVGLYCPPMTPEEAWKERQKRDRR